jgi:hypothetical protein
VPGLIEAFRQTGTAAMIDREITLKRRKRGLSASEMVESLLAMWAAGGERAEDLDQFRQDKALALLLGHELPAAQTARDFLAQFHAEDLPLLQEGKAGVPAESTPLLGLATANTELVLDLQCRRPVKTATLDVDATVIACDKRAAKRAYDGNRGYQPVLALWAEQDAILADEFRDGNVPAGSGNRRVVEKALAALPGGIDKIYLRGDSALYEHELMRWLDERAIGYASPRCRRTTGNPTEKKLTRSASGPRSTICRATGSGAKMRSRRAVISPSASARVRASCCATATACATSASSPTAPIPQAAVASI